MAKVKTVFICNNCGAQLQKWQGQCSFCHNWNTLAKFDAAAVNYRYQALTKNNLSCKLADINVPDMPRYLTGISEFDRVLGGGLVTGSVVLIGGDPGIGKSTLLLQALSKISSERRALYISGEESSAQIALRAQRLGLLDKHVNQAGELQLLEEVQLQRLQVSIDAIKPDIIVLDSIQTIYSDVLSSSPGSVAQVRECASQLTRIAKQSGATIIMVGHVTKEGALAGPRVLEHIVDTVLYFEGDTHLSFRLVRAFKNRFGAANELGIFAMTERGLHSVSNPSALFLSQHKHTVPGSCVLVTQEGSRPFLVEVQALVDTAQALNPRRLAVGLEQNRLAMLLAVLHRHAGIVCFDQDIFLNVVGGVKIVEPAADLAVLLAIQSSMYNKPLPHGLIVFGEVGLAGEIRPCIRGQERLKEAMKLGFAIALIPKANIPKQPIDGLHVIAVERIEQAIEEVKALGA
ncbi:DNA repair protein RadA [Candidatus Vallotia tarda]|nr:DNA repair protein RadA [Candidatus Vallotia tarda]